MGSAMRPPSSLMRKPGMWPLMSTPCPDPAKSFLLTGRISPKNPLIILLVRMPILSPSSSTSMVLFHLFMQLISKSNGSARIYCLVFGRSVAGHFGGWGFYFVGTHPGVCVCCGCGDGFGLFALHCGHHLPG